MNMPGVPPLQNKELKQFMFFFKAVEKSMGFVPNSLKTMARIPAIMGSFSALSGILLGDPAKASPMTFLKLAFNNMRWTAKFMKNQERVPLYLRHLVSYVTSRASGCQYCQAHTISSVKESGISDEKFEAIWEFETSPLYDAKERAALRFGIAAGSVPNAVTGQHFDDLREHFTNNQIVELGSVIATFGYLNRWNDTFATQLEPIPNQVADIYLKDHGWELGKHS